MQPRTDFRDKRVKREETEMDDFDSKLMVNALQLVS